VPDIYRFQNCELEHGTRTLREAGREVAVAPKVFDLLLLLLRYRDRVLTKVDLKAALWPDVTVSDAAVTRLVKEARRAVGDDGGRQRVIKTVQRRGYRFAAAVQVGSDDARREHGKTLLSAGADALLREAYAEAEIHYRRAIALLSERNRGHAALLFEALLALAETQQRSPSGAVDRVMLRRAVAIARVHGMRDEHARAVLTLAGDGPNWRIDPDLLALLGDAWGRATDPGLRARLLARAATEHCVAPLAPEAHELRTRALAAARDAGPLAMVHVLGAREDWVWQVVPPLERGALATACVDAAERDGDRAQGLTARLLRLRERLEAGDGEAFDREAEALDRLTRGAAERRFRYRLERLRITRATMTGRFEHADALLEQVSQPPCGYGIGEVWDDQTAQVTALLAACERFDDIAPVCGPSSHAAPAVTARCVQVWLDAAGAEHVQARYELRELLRIGDLERLHPADAAMVAASCALLGEAEPAASLERALAPLAGRHVLRGELVCYGPCDDFRGMLAELSGDTSAARTLYRRGLELADRSGARLARIRAWIHLAQVSAPEEARGLAGLAEAEAEALGLARAAARARAIRDAAGRRTDAGPGAHRACG
jgi:DNA-binding winged helix-turn-helix (wHTH) protein